MKRYLFLFTLLLLLSSIIVSADAPFNYRYEGDSHKSSVSYYNYHTANRAYIPTFKGSYGNYRYEIYSHGDYSPNYFFVNYPDFGFGPYFGGGYGLIYNYPYNYGYWNYPYYGYYNYPSYNYNFII
jgi:hypothetical protein